MQKRSKNYINKTIFILGASSDIGLETVKLFLNNGFYVFAHYNNNSTKLKKIKNKNLEIIKYDLRRIKFFERYLKKNKKLLKVSHFLSLSGYIEPKNIFNFKIEKFYDHINVNYLSNLIFLRNSIGNMEKNKFGRVLLTSSIGTKFGGGLNTYMYSISKFMNEFLPQYFRSVARYNIAINVLQIGLTDTKLILKDKSKNLKKRVSLIPIKRMAKTAEVADHIYTLLSKKNALLTNQMLNISGGE